MKDGEFLIPAGETEFARDKTFSFKSSKLAEYVEEKTCGAFKKESVTKILLSDLRNYEVEKTSRQLEKVTGFNKVVVDAVEYGDIKIFTAALLKILANWKNFLFRTAAAFPKIIGNISDKNFLTREEIVSANNPNGGLIIVGSHVNKTNLQLAELKKIPSIKFIEFDILNFPSTEKISAQIESEFSAGKTTVLYTSRKVFESESKEKSLLKSVEISNALTKIVKKIQVQPKFLIAKGGITSADVGTKDLGVKKALVLGQIAAGIPVWKIGNESKFPGMSYIIFPSNVGEYETLYKIVKNLER